nr:hypothetical protein [Pedobacter panaciterrae]
MLTGCLFENRVGVKLLGDTSDLISLHKTVRKITLVIVDYELEDTDVSNILVDFLENIEKAYTGIAISEEKTIHRNQAIYYGFQSSWTELLMVSSLLRLLSEYVVTDELDDINMRLLEYIIRETTSSINKQEYIAINSYIEKGALRVSIKQFIKGFDAMINNKFTYEKH